jgi:hypothetical protein
MVVRGFWTRGAEDRDKWRPRLHPATTSDAQCDRTDPMESGTPDFAYDCVHVHWRWPEWIKYIPGNKKFGNGNVLVPKTQFVKIYALAQHDNEIDPPDFNVDALLDGENIYVGDIVMWQLATDRTNASGTGIFNTNHWFLR